MKNNKQKQKGQIAIIVLLASAIILTLGLSASKKTTTETKIETDEESLKEAFNTAESAINNYINSKETTYTTESGGNASVSSSPIGNADSIASDGQILANSNQLFWLVNHEDNGDIGSTYYSGSSVTISVDSGFTGALKIDYFYKNGAVYSVNRSGYNFNSNLVTNYPSTSNNYINLDLSGGNPLLISITPIGSATNITISGSKFPLQGEDLTSVGTTGDGVKTQIKTRDIYLIPPFMFEAVTAKGSIQ